MPPKGWHTVAALLLLLLLTPTRQAVTLAPTATLSDCASAPGVPVCTGARLPGRLSSTKLDSDMNWGW